MPTGPLRTRPTTLRKPIDDMTRAELVEERDYFRRIAADDTRPSTARNASRIIVRGCEAALAKLDAQDDAPNAVVGPSLSLFHRVPVLEADPVLKTE